MFTREFAIEESEVTIGNKRRKLKKLKK